MWRAVSICVVAWMRPSRAHRPCANAWRDRVRAVRPLRRSPLDVRSRRPRSRNLPPPKPRPSSGHPDSSRDARWISTAAARAGGSERRTGTFHSPVTGVFGASSPPRKPPNILVSPIAGVRLLEWRFAHLPRPAKAFDSCDTPRRMAPFRRPGCLEPLLGHDGGGDCSPEDRSSLGLRLTASDRPLGDAALLTRTLPTERSTLGSKAPSFRPSHGRGERRLEPLVKALPAGFPA